MTFHAILFTLIPSMDAASILKGFSGFRSCLATYNSSRHLAVSSPHRVAMLLPLKFLSAYKVYADAQGPSPCENGMFAIELKFPLGCSSETMSVGNAQLKARHFVRTEVYGGFLRGQSQENL